LVGNGEPSRPVFRSRRIGAEFVEIDGRVGINKWAGVRKPSLLGSINRGDRLEGNHVVVVPGLEFDQHVRPFPSRVGIPLN